MTYFLTVWTYDQGVIRKAEPYETLDDALKVISDNYLENTDNPWRFAGKVALRDGKIDRIKILPTKTMAGPHLRDDIQLIEVISEYQLLAAQNFLVNPLP